MNEEIEQEEVELQQALQQVEELEQIAKKWLTKEAIARFGNLKLAHPELALKAAAAIAQAASLNQLTRPLSDQEFKALLLELQQKRPYFRFRK